VYRQIEENYIEDGKVRVSYIHYAFLGPESILAAEASECAADQDAFWEYHDMIYDLRQESRTPLSESNLKEFAIELGLNEDEFNTCLDSGKYKQLVQEDVQVSRSIGVQSAPSFIINQQPVVGAQPYEVFEQIIEAELAKQ
jgi:protein-disulfide isomerase